MDLAILQGLFESRLMTLNHVTHLYFNGHGETGMNLAALQYDLKLCREHGTYIDLKTLAFAIHHVLQDDTDALVEHLSAYAASKRE